MATRKKPSPKVIRPVSSEIVHITHPGVVGEGYVSLRAFQEVYQELGWTLVEDGSSAEATAADKNQEN